jgi:hypothetical protein
MKAPALKFDKDSLLDFLLNHCEKIVVTLVAGGAAILLWGGMNAVRLESVQEGQTPEAIAALADAAGRHIDAQRKPPADTFLQGGKLAAQIDPWRPQTVKVTAGPSVPAVLDRPLFQELSKRSKPEVLPIEDLRAVSGIAVFPNLADPAAAGMVPPRDMAPPAQDPGQRPGRRDRRPPRQPEGSPDMGGLPGFAQGPRGRIVPYVVVTGLVPVAKQRSDFDRCFGSAGFRDATLDAPRWGQYLVERTTVAPGAAERWERMQLKNVDAFGQGGNPVAPPGNPAGAVAEPLQAEVLPQAFLMTPTEADIGYAAALPQRIDDAWGSATIHPWFLPQLKRLLAEAAPGFAADRPEVDIDAKTLAATPDEYEAAIGTLKGVSFVGEAMPQPQAGVVAFGIEAADGVKFPASDVGNATAPVFVLAAPWARTLALEGGPSEGVKCNVRVRMESLGQTPVARVLGIRYLGADGQPGEEVSDPSPFPLNAGAADATGQAPGGVAIEGAEYRLFRFVDTSVKPGQQYRYRVKFLLRNPNFGLDRQHLADPASAKGEFLVSKESNATPAVAIPDPTSIVVRPLPKDEIKQRKMKPGTLEILVMAASGETGNYTLRSLVTEPGGLANVDSALNKPGDARTRGENIVTDRVLVDLRGRQEENAKPGEPFEVLFLKPDGTFEFVSAADGHESYTRYAATLPAGETGAKTDRPPSGMAPGANPFETPPR